MDEVVRWVGLLTGLTPLDLIICVIQSSQEPNLMTQKAYVVHHIPGRLRLRVPDRRNDPEFFNDVSTRLSTCDSVRDVAVNPITAGILVIYEGDLPTLLMQATGAGLAELADIEVGLPPLVPMSERLMGRLHEVDGRISQATHGAVDGTTLTVLSLLLAGSLQVVRGQVLGSAVPLLWYAWQAVSSLPTRQN